MQQLAGSLPLTTSLLPLIQPLIPPLPLQQSAGRLRPTHRLPVTTHSAPPLLAAGYSCSDLRGVCRSAAMLPVREVMTAHAAVLNAALACPSSSSSSGGGPDASVAETWADQGPADESALRHLVPRALCLRDFIDALELIRPTDVDQDRFALA